MKPHIQCKDLCIDLLIVTLYNNYSIYIYIYRSEDGIVENKATGHMHLSIYDDHQLKISWRTVVRHM